MMACLHDAGLGVTDRCMNIVMNALNPKPVRV